MEARLPKLKKNWVNDPQECVFDFTFSCFFSSLKQFVFDVSELKERWKKYLMRCRSLLHLLSLSSKLIFLRPRRTKERLKFVLRQYELRERHFECFVRSRELELLLAKYREQEQGQLVEFERSRIDKLEEDVSSDLVVLLSRRNNCLQRLF